jgi:hypothetical protein
MIATLPSEAMFRYPIDKKDITLDVEYKLLYFPTRMRTCYLRRYLKNARVDGLPISIFT